MTNFHFSLRSARSAFRAVSFIILLSPWVTEPGAQAANDCRTLFLPPKTSSVSVVAKPVAGRDLDYVLNRYGIRSSEVQLTPELGLPVVLRNDGHETLAPRRVGRAQKPPVREAKDYDVVIVGGGPSGLTAALYLAEAGKSVLVLERSDTMGGLGRGSELMNVRSAGGAAYSAGPDGGLQYKIFQKIGLGPYKKKLSIPEPIDSYLWNGRLYEGIWEEHTLQQLPASFALFKHALLTLADSGAGATEGQMAQWADNMNMAELVRKMPDLVASWGDQESLEIHRRFASDTRLSRQDPMKNVIDLLDLYGRSALGGPAELISARQFIDFYESEIYTRYTGPFGTGTIMEALKSKLEKYSDLVTLRTSAPVSAIENHDGRVRTTFLSAGADHEVVAKKVVFAAPLPLAARLIDGLAEQDPQKAQALSEIQMTDYAVHVAHVKGHPYRATYDTWVYNGGNLDLPTDFILGRWQDPKIKAYEGLRDFVQHPDDDRGIITIYHQWRQVKNFRLSRQVGENSLT